MRKIDQGSDVDVESFLMKSSRTKFEDFAQHATSVTDA